MPENAFIKAERIVRTMLGVLEREIQLPGLVWRDAGGDFKGAKNDTITIRLPAYATARTRVLRAGTPITVDSLNETSVDVTLNTDVYKAIGVSLEQLTLDVESFEDQVAVPVTHAVARGLEDALATEIAGATYDLTETISTSAPAEGIIDARRALNMAQVPQAGRALLVGADVESAILKDEQFIRVDASGSDSALRDATIGRIAGFPVNVNTTIDPGMAYAFHKTAFVMSTRAPAVPQGATVGSSRSFAGLSMTAIQDYDFINATDRFGAHCFVGTNVVQDHGDLDSSGRFVPAVDPDTDGGTDLVFVRAVELTLS